MSNADAWGLPGVLSFFDAARSTVDQVYPSEWFFLRDRLRRGMNVLDVGCAQGGFAAILGEHLDHFHYTGIDINAEMIAKARQRHPGHEFHVVAEDTEWQCLGGRQFDLVMVLGILHLHEGWRDTIARAWGHTGSCLMLDLREHQGQTLEDKTMSSFSMCFGADDDLYEQTRLPYVIVNSAEALAEVRRNTPGAGRVSHYGYLHPVSAAARTPVAEVMTNVWCVER
ncbi:class I SAM-dependent methyltransferase [Magnetospirillum gryphiswaldense]|uniref:Methyltransferase type 12 domain-containing protein n=1 Tax=Magnetospirillum gryphiswaldense TaxID=55518 RepID=A4U157_9PROT|nr:class I SAM-dependent methyltransferase [Magnetospirillum gryphiswaldense]AVM75605.1 hypothetical protein MSR1_31390 [Magnetospirillum gryphiswaldense MSR-1]AVM79508.1 hypothetical protein MSR1L_31390 [Magnetospirillum gryphiswaldense]CAM76614.1 hypothetical protein MGR_1144 [Magnetospirillum gryphiswaldense MSR-1]